VLDELRIAGLGVIDEAVLPLDPGLTVLTGETGAGKTMLVTALLLLFGSRADATRVRAGAAQASVDGRILLGPDTVTAQRVADAGGAVDDDGSLQLRRLVAATGRSRAFIGGAPAPVTVLAELAERLVVVHGQADQLRLIRPAQQRAALDQFAGIDTSGYAASFQTWRLAAERLADRSARARELRLEAEMLTHGLAEITAAEPLPGEDVELASEANRLAHIDSLRLAARAAHDAVLGDPDDPATDAVDVAVLLGRARRAVAQVAGADPQLDEIGQRLDDLAAAANDIGAELASYRDHLDADPNRLAGIEARRSVLAGLTRRYGPDLDAVLEWAKSAEARLSELDVSDEALARLADDRDQAERRTATLATALSKKRTAAAKRLAAAVTVELAGLAMASASIVIEVSQRAPVAGTPTLTVDAGPAAANESGVDDVEIRLQSHPDSPAVALGRGASGGELSRVMLAIEVCLADTDPVATMVFDEVDAGVGGRAAVELGARLARLSRAHQVIVVTHLAQVAAFADRHIVVDKPGAQHGVTRSDVRTVEGEDRIAELARMLAGSDSPAAREHAAELLASAARDHARPTVEKAAKRRDQGRR
jgi:DNA repair protein RecN (Recombination protein N)